MTRNPGHALDILCSNPDEYSSKAWFHHVCIYCQLAFSYIIPFVANIAKFATFLFCTSFSESDLLNSDLSSRDECQYHCFIHLSSSIIFCLFQLWPQTSTVFIFHTARNAPRRRTRTSRCRIDGRPMTAIAMLGRRTYRAAGTACSVIIKTSTPDSCRRPDRTLARTPRPLVADPD